MDRFGKALPENLSGHQVIMRPGAPWRYEYTVSSVIPTPGIQTWKKVRKLVDGRAEQQDRTKYCPITLVKLDKDTVMFAPRRSPILEDGRHYHCDAIRAWLEKYPYCPLDRLPLAYTDLVPSSIQGLRMMQADTRRRESQRVYNQWRYRVFQDLGSMWIEGKKVDGISIEEALVREAKAKVDQAKQVEDEEEGKVRQRRQEAAEAARLQREREMEDKKLKDAAQ